MGHLYVAGGIYLSFLLGIACVYIKKYTLLQPKLFFLLFFLPSQGENDLGKDANTQRTLTSPVQHVHDHQMGV